MQESIMRDRVLVLFIELQTRWKLFFIILAVFSLIAILIGMPSMVWAGLSVAIFAFYMGWYVPATRTDKVNMTVDHWQFLLDHASEDFNRELVQALPLTLKGLKEALEKAEEAVRERQQAETTEKLAELIKGKDVPGE